MKRAVVLGLVAGLGLGASAMGQVWNEAPTNGNDFAGLPDASSIPNDGGNNITAGVGPLTTINGSQHSPREWDVYQIAITDEASFSVTADGYTQGNPNAFLALFDSTGAAVAFNNDHAALSLSSAHVTSNGLYYLAFGGRGEIYANTFGEILFPFADPAGEHAPSMTVGGAVATQTVLTGLPLRFTGRRDYTLTLTGSGYAVIPAPGAAALLGLGGLMMVRRRR